MLLGLPLQESADRLARYGFTVSHGDDLPEQADELDVRTVAFLTRSGASGLPYGRCMSLFQILRVARKLGVTVPEAAERLTRLGLDVPDTRAAVAEALQRVPWAGDPPG